MKSLLLAMVLALWATRSFGLPAGFHYKVLIDGLDLVSAEVLPDGRVLAVEKHGRIHLINQGTGAKTVALDWEAKTRSNFEAGMTEVLADPDFAASGYVYVQYCNKQVGANGKDWVSRFTMKGNTIDGTTEFKILDLGDAGPNYHHGSGLGVNPRDGMLYVASGSRFGGGFNAAGAAAAANSAMVEGKILRVKIPGGDIPSDNPYFGRNTGDARAVYHYGVRNPFTLTFHPTTGEMRFSDVAPDAKDDRVNLGLSADNNYGYHNDGSDPYAGAKGALWTAGGVGGGGGAMVGGLFYTGANFPEKYRNMYFVGQIRGWGGNLRVCFNANCSQREEFGPFNLPDGAVTDYNPIDIKMDAAGAVYVSTRFQTENVRWAKGRVIKVWYGEKEPTLPTTMAEAGTRAFASMGMRWSVLPGGGLSVEALRDGAYGVELRRADGSLAARHSLPGRGTVRFPGSFQGLHFLVWKSPGKRSVVKVIF